MRRAPIPDARIIQQFKSLNKNNGSDGPTARKFTISPEHGVKLLAEFLVELRHAHILAELGHACDAVITNAAWHDCVVMAQIRCQIYRNTMKTHPTAQPDSDSGNLVFSTVRPPDPDTDPFRTGFTLNPEFRQGLDHPVLDRVNIPARIALATAQIQHEIGYPLTGTMIGDLSSTAHHVNRKGLCVEHIGRLRAGSGCDRGWMLKKPDCFIFLSVVHGFHPAFHFGDRVRDTHRVS